VTVGTQCRTQITIVHAHGRNWQHGPAKRKCLCVYVKQFYCSERKRENRDETRDRSGQRLQICTYGNLNLYIHKQSHSAGSRDCVVGMVTRLRIGRPRNGGSIPGWDKGFNSALKCADRFWGPHSLRFNGHEDCSARVKRLRREGDYSPHLMPSSE
jgi:hypothetical protein